MKYKISLLATRAMQEYGVIGFELTHCEESGELFYTREVDTVKDQLTDVTEAIKGYKFERLDLMLGHGTLYLAEWGLTDNEQFDDGTMHLLLLTEGIAIATALCWDVLELRQRWYKLHMHLIDSAD